MCFVLYVTFVSGTKNSPHASQQVVTQVYIPPSMTFAGETVPLHQREVRERLDRELTSITFRHSHTIRILKLANRYLPTIEKILRANNVPEDFKYLAVAESSLENLTSPKNAKGYWQFLSNTARSFGLEVSDDVEERYHLEKATVAACKYFKKAHNKFGNWTMAAASYNRGMQGMQNAINSQKVNNYYDLYLNSETARYVFRIAAYKQLMENASQYGFHFYNEDLYPPHNYREMVVTSIPNVPDFARQQGTTYRAIKMLNPWLKRTSLKAKSGKSYTIKIPQ